MQFNPQRRPGSFVIRPSRERVGAECIGRRTWSWPKGSSETESSETGCPQTGLPGSGETGTRDVGAEDAGNWRHQAQATQQWEVATGDRRPGNQTSVRQGPGRPRACGGCGRCRQQRRPSGRVCTAISVEPPPAGVFAPVGATRSFRTRRVDGWCGDGHFDSKRSASWSSEHGTGSQRARGVRQLVAAGKPRRKAGADKKPHEWQRSSRSQRGRGANRRGSEKLRGRNVPGEASPGRADPVTDVAEGAPEPQEGNRRL